MIKNTISIAIRHLLKDKAFSLINLTSLVIGFATFCLISMFIFYEFNWDKHNANYSRIYQLQLKTTHFGRKDFTSSVPGAIRYHVLDKVPEVEKAVLIHGSAGMNENFGEFISSGKDNLIYEKAGFYAEQTVFDIFTFHFIEGTSENALTSPTSIVLSKTMAAKIFPDGKALGKQVFIEKKYPLTVAGVYDDLPLNSFFRPAYITSMGAFTPITRWQGFENNWEACGFSCFVLLAENADPASVDRQIENCLVNKKENNFAYLRPFSKMHTSPNFQSGLLIAYSLFSLVALLVLILSSFNFINLQTVNAITRSREIGIKKVMGGSSQSIRIQFMVESFIITLIAAVLGLCLANLLVPVFNYIMGFNYEFHVFRNTELLLTMLAVTCFTGFVSGFYPAFVISSMNPVTSLKQKVNSSPEGRVSFKKVLVTTQLSISLFLLIVSLIILRQANYMMKKDMGFDMDNVLFASIKSTQEAPVEEMRQRLIKYPEITSISFSQFVPFIVPTGDDVNWQGGEPAQKLFIRKNQVNYDFIPTFKIELIAGRNFSRDYPTDIQNACIINESMMRKIGWDNPVGKQIWDNRYTVIGVIKDFHMHSAADPIDPCVLRLTNKYDTDGMYAIRYVPGNEKKVKQILQQEFEKSYPSDGFEFISFRYFFDHHPDFAAWTSFKRIFLAFTSINILIASMGLFGLILFTSKRKLKEIGIRKILGSSVWSIYQMLSLETFFLLGIAVIVAFPAGYYVYEILPGAYKFEISIWEFMISLMVVIAVAGLTISYHVLRAATRNPVEALRYE